ncbi:rfaE bifunctional protein nucleotidyltransferase chain/domain [Mucilaginibacter sp. SG538B]|uniref:D-glycero-beta-D-manno-heptose 1-phosphate adenylyltransferase n=1 Tax=unclassified Mucilaginibacter TaxID=2617802 RepID=UPI00159D8F79|nr:D-glycero-beta-D-manno-heptose 1-phosphate adenylyltransferase [Mucilaginibacter sp. SG538B]NVM66533.1 rfaE bifunctional protein nucleotidyltransferase chain/domain [Mucilaginibacter sp. SG538B]
MENSLSALLSKKVYNLPALLQQVTNWKDEGQQIVFTNGVFDVLHIGHVSYLLKAKELGDKLIIGLNSDTSVSRLKGPNRPINNQHDRAALLSALYFVDAIVGFEDDTPLNLITNINPDILVKGGDYTVENIVGSQEVQARGGRVETIIFVEGVSSTKIIEKLQAQASE